jgi:predicted unusual protein kinase regulating ubiquinone biosynthesis (AarF/ABC1/UbiB family)/N-methylhydantoinase B/oxoprolinase/acetone carboxylase alpha subunit
MNAFNDIPPAELSGEEQQLVAQFLTSNAGFVGPDPLILNDHKFGPRSAQEEQALQEPIDLHLFQEIRNRLTSVLDENFEISEQTVAAPAAKFADLCTAFMTGAGDVALLSNRGVSGFAVVMHYPVRHILKYFANDPSVGLREGDAFIVNDARFGGIHSPDQSMVMPFFHEGKLVAWTVCAMHEGEVGARAPGGMGPTIESPYEEGFRGSPIKIAENFRLKADIVTLIQNAVREKEVMLVDIRARLATCIRLAESLTKTIHEFGLLPVLGAMRHTLELVAEETARRIEALPRGTVRTAFYIDSTTRETALLKFNVALKCEGHRMVVDLRGSAPEIANRSLNCPITASKIGLMQALMSFFWPDLPKSPAVLQHFDVLADPKSMVNCSYEAPIAMNVMTGFKLITAMEVLMAKLSFSVPTKFATIKAPWYNQPAGMMYGGETQYGHEVGNICADLNGMAGGARANRDGEHSICANFAQMNDIGESEDTEEDLPVVMLSSKKFTPDVGSFGKFRGGSGYQTMYTRFGRQNFGFQAITTGSKFPSTVGLFGGYACPTYPLVKVKGINVFDELKEKPQHFNVDVVELLSKRPFRGASYETVPGSLEFELAFEGELYVLHQGAGGAYGDVLDRAPELVVKDLKEGLISSWTARHIYQVAVNDDTFAVDLASTQRLREEERQRRRTRGKRWADFVANDVTRSPPIGVMFFGCWNDSQEIYGGMYRALPGQFPREIYMPDSKMIYEAVLHQKKVSGTAVEEQMEYQALEKEFNEPLAWHSLRKLGRLTGLNMVLAGRAAGVGLRSLLQPAATRRDYFLTGVGKALSQFMHDAGPTFIKLGQVWSMRPDLLGTQITRELANLQDNVTPMPSDTIVAIIERSLGKPVSELYREFDRKPLAAGSVAQVHKAVLKDGRAVVVKVKRPNLDERISADLGALSSLLALASKLVPGVRDIRPIETINELGRAVRGQMNFRAEVKNNRRFAHELRHLDWLRLPQIHDELCSDDVITMEYIRGLSPSAYVKKRGSYAPELAEKIYRMYIDMAFRNRFLHADLHAGNIMIDENDRVVLIDTGLAHEFPNYYVKRYLRIYLCIAAVDGYLQIDNYYSGRTHLITPEAKKALGFDMHVMYQKWDKNRQKDLTVLWLRVMVLLRKHKVVMDRELMMMMISDITMSGVVHEFDPAFDVVEFVRHEIPRLIFNDGKLALNDPYLLSASRRDLLKDIRTAMGMEVPDIDFAAQA